jgi:hypothetical protein
VRGDAGEAIAPEKTNIAAMVMGAGFWKTDENSWPSTSPRTRKETAAPVAVTPGG